ncbi:Uncharacterised protein [Mycolicibacterium vanbaalenii]|uniref:Uncharacterized protein n=1 Tax=Mycolicibacterium vanbaalenii TaxID=110539 RepID=A0A5S9R439_MYCVN|nr:Uncharacterised protein [Mycolicibacterium vanbaalenii]
MALGFGGTGMTAPTTARHGAVCVCVRCCDNDAAREDTVYAAERDEARSARFGMSEMERARSCRHQVGRSGACRQCGEQLVTRDEA